MKKCQYLRYFFSYVQLHDNLHIMPSNFLHPKGVKFAQYVKDHNQMVIVCGDNVQRVSPILFLRIFRITDDTLYTIWTIHAIVSFDIAFAVLCVFAMVLVWVCKLWAFSLIYQSIIACL